MTTSGDARVNQQMMLVALHTVFMREHNRVALELSKINPQWDDERLFQVSLPTKQQPKIKNKTNGIIGNVGNASYCCCYCATNHIQRILAHGVGQGSHGTFRPPVAQRSMIHLLSISKTKKK